jgi:hypothetical protein
MLKNLRPKQKESFLWVMEKNYTIEELDDEFGIIPGKVTEGEVRLEAEMAVVEIFEAERWVVRDMGEGKFVDGIWWDVVLRYDWDGVMELVGGWARRQDVLAEKAAVMDARCVEITRRVWHSVL